jgi:hypothetical protein
MLKKGANDALMSREQLPEGSLGPSLPGVARRGRTEEEEGKKSRRTRRHFLLSSSAALAKIQHLDRHRVGGVAPLEAQ